MSDVVSEEEAESLIGHYAGAVTRFCAFLVDAVLSIGAFEIGAASFVWIVNLFTRSDLHANGGGPWWFIPLTGWLFLYFWYCYWLAGKTPGKALFGLRVVKWDGSDLRGGRAAVRVVTFPLNWMFFGIGFLGIVFGRRRRTWADMIANTAVIYDYDARGARLRRLLIRRTPPAETIGEPTSQGEAFTTAG